MCSTFVSSYKIFKTIIENLPSDSRSIPTALWICRFAIKQALVHLQQSSLLMKCLRACRCWRRRVDILAILSYCLENRLQKLSNVLLLEVLSDLSFWNNCFTPGKKFIVTLLTNTQQSQPLSNGRTSRLACARMTIVTIAVSGGRCISFHKHPAAN